MRRAAKAAAAVLMCAALLELGTSGASLAQETSGGGAEAQGATSDAAGSGSGTAEDAQSAAPQTGAAEEAAREIAAPLGAAPPGHEPEGALVRPEITWRVENPFRFFTDAADTEVHRATFLALSPEERRFPILAAERQLSQRHPFGWAETMVRDTCWDPSRNRYACPGKESYIEPESHKVLARIEGVEEGAVDCTWLTAPRGGKRRRGAALKRPCADPIRLDVPYPGGLKVSVEIGGIEVASADIRVRDILIAAMGDSFGSGEGNPDVPVRFSSERSIDYGKAEKYPEMAGYPARAGSWKQVSDKGFIAENARWLDTACRRSLYSHQLRAALQLAVEDPHRAVTFAGFACSGAETTWGLFLRYKGNEWVPNPPELSQVSALAQIQCGDKEAPAQDYPEAYHIGGVVRELEGGLVLRRCGRDDARAIDLLFVSIGGNDIGFARLVANAVLSDESSMKKLGGWFGQVHGNSESETLLEALDERYKALNRAVHGVLHLSWDESDRVILTAYPPLALLEGGGHICPDGSAGMDVLSTFNLSEGIARESTTLANHLQRVMANSADVHGWSFADQHRKAFIGRGLCAGYTDNALSLADDLRFPRLRDGKWDPFNPADYRPYASRQRWFRTPNDAFLTGNFHVAGSVLQKALKLDSLSWFQVLLASTYSGAFHPNAEGHAAMADAVAERARQVLDKYRQTSEAGLKP